MNTSTYVKTVMYLVSLAAFSDSAWPQTELSLEQAAAKVLAQNRQVLQAQAEVQIRKEEAAAARTKRWPALTVSVMAGPLLNRASVMFPKGSLGDFGSTGPIPGEDTMIGIPRKLGGFSTSQFALPISQQARIGLGIRTADLETKSSEAQAEATAQQAVALARNLYFQIVALEAARATASSQVKVAEEVLRLAELGVAEETNLPADLLEAQSRLARAQTDAEDLEEDIQNGREQLNLLMGEPLGVQFQFVSRPQGPDAIDLEDVRARAAENRPEIRAARLRLEQAELSIRSKKLEWIPDLNLTLTHFAFLNAGNLAPRQVAIAGLSMSWEPWDWGRKSSETRAAHRRCEQARLALEQTEAQVGFEAGRAWREYERAQHDLNAARTAVQAGTELLRVARQRYEQQAALLRTVLEAQAAWELAGQEEARAAAAVGTAWSNLQLAMGE